MKWIEMKLRGVGADATGKNPILILRTIDDKTSVGIWIGFADAAMLLPLLEGKPTQRPNSHDVFTTFIKNMGAQVNCVQITDMMENIYYSKIILETPKGEVQLDSRPSDAISMAIRNNAPIFMSDKAMEKSFAGESLPQMEDTTDKGKQLASYLHHLPAESFGKEV